MNQPISKWWLCIIPASTKEKTETRFKIFCDTLCDKTELKNGYLLLSNKSDREAAHLTEDRRLVNIIDSINFGDVRGKKILLFDDVYTTGRSFLEVARKLSRLGQMK